MNEWPVLTNGKLPKFLVTTFCIVSRLISVLTFLLQPVENKVDQFPVLSLFRSDIGGLYNPHYHVHLICNWRSLERVCTNSTRCCLSSAQVVSIQSISWSFDSVKNTERFPCLCKRKCYSDFQTQNLFSSRPSPTLTTAFVAPPPPSKPLNS